MWAVKQWRNWGIMVGLEKMLLKYSSNDCWNLNVFVKKKKKSKVGRMIEIIIQKKITGTSIMEGIIKKCDKSAT